MCTALVLEFCSLRLSYIEMTVMCMLHMHSLKFTLQNHAFFLVVAIAAMSTELWSSMDPPKKVWSYYDQVLAY